MSEPDKRVFLAVLAMLGAPTEAAKDDIVARINAASDEDIQAAIDAIGQTKRAA